MIRSFVKSVCVAEHRQSYHRTLGSSSQSDHRFLLMRLCSMALFSPELCDRCERFVVEPCYPDWPEVCSECEVRGRCPFVAVFLRHILRREPLTDMVATVAGFCATNRTPGRRLHFLHSVLLSRNSCFRQFTFCGGGFDGSISQTEDVLDRIMSFLGKGMLQYIEWRPNRQAIRCRETTDAPLPDP